MPLWPRLVLFALAFAIPAMSGIDGEGTDDLIGGILILASIFWPGATYAAQTPGGSYEVRSKGPWPSPAALEGRLSRDFGQPAPWLADRSGWDGIVVRMWSFPFPMRHPFTVARQYPTDP